MRCRTASDSANARVAAFSTAIVPLSSAAAAFARCLASAVASFASFSSASSAARSATAPAS